MIKNIIKSVVKRPIIDNIDLSILDLAPVGWWDASDESTITESGGSVSQWDDKSGGGFHFVQATGANQPTYSGGVITFDGVTNLMTCANVIPDGDITAIVLYKPLSGYSGGYILSNQGSGAIKSRFYVLVDRIDLGNTALLHSLDSADQDIIVSIWANDIGDGSTQNIQVNSNTSFTGSVDRLLPADDLAVGAFYTGSAYFKGEVKEIILFNYELDATIRLKIEHYLSDKWGVEL